MTTLKELKELATNMGVAYQNNAGVEKMIALIKTHCDENNIPYPPEVVVTEESVEADKATIAAETALPLTATVEEENPEITKLRTLRFAEAEKVQSAKEASTRTKEALKHVRCIVRCNNRNKAAYVGEIFSVRNSMIEEVKKFVPFNKPVHIPKIMFNMMSEKTYQTFREEKLPNGNKVKVSVFTPEYTLEVLPPLTADEFNAIKQRQLADSGI